MSLASSSVKASNYIVTAGFLAGLLDALGAILVLQAKPAPMFKYIASGLIGPAAFQGGSGMVVLGVLIHFAIAFSWTILFFALFDRLKLNRLPKAVTIILYGIVIWVVMNLVVLPLTQVKTGTFSWIPALKGVAILIIAVALPVCLLSYRYHEKKVLTSRT